MLMMSLQGVCDAHETELTSSMEVRPLPFSFSIQLIPYRKELTKSLFLRRKAEIEIIETPGVVRDGVYSPFNRRVGSV